LEQVSKKSLHIADMGVPGDNISTFSSTGGIEGISPLGIEFGEFLIDQDLQVPSNPINIVSADMERNLVPS
jgi:hypothetical protein